MAKKLRCGVVPSDWVRIVKYGEDTAVQVKVGGEKTDIFLTHEDAKKLRKQIEKALAEIEGEEVRSESLDGEFKWLVDGDIRPIQNWKPKEGEKVLIVESTYVPSVITRSWIGNFGFICWTDGDLCKVYNEAKSDYFGFHTSDLRPAE